MSLECINMEEDKRGRPVGIYIDTDDLSQDEYYEYCRLKKEKGNLATLNYLRTH